MTLPLAPAPPRSPPTPVAPPERFGGPVYAFELVRLARGGRLARLRTLYGLALLAALLVTYIANFPGVVTWEAAFAGGPLIAPSRAAEFAEAFVDTTLVTQFAAVLLLTPIIAAGAVGEERQRRTLDALRTTAIDDFTIVAGKWAARVAHVGGVLLIGLPALSLMQLFGGVDLGRLVAAFAVTAATLLSLAALSLWCSALWSPLRATCTAFATALAFGVATLVLQLACLPAMDYVGSLNPVIMMALVIAGPDAEVCLSHPALGVACYGLLHGLAAWWMLANAARCMRLQLAGAELLPVLDAPDRAFVVPPIDDDRPLLWKERYFGAGAVIADLPRIAVAAAGLVLVWKVIDLAIVSLFGRDPNPLLAAGTVVVLGGSCLTAALFAAGSVSREREARTLDNLLALPGDWSNLLRAKWWGSVWRVRGPLFFLAGVWALALFTGALHPLALPLLTLTAAAHLGCAVSLGLYRSVAAGGTGRAVTLTVVFALLPTAAVLFPGPLKTVAPPAAWFLLTFPLATTAESVMTAAPIAAINVATYALVGGALYFAAVRRFARESEPPVVTRARRP